MVAAWELSIPATEKMVLLCLCDHANDDGQCWPSMNRLAAKCSLTDRTVRKAIKWLIDHKQISAATDAGKVNRYQINPGICFTPEAASALPRKDIPPTPEAASAEPSLTVIEPSVVDMARASNERPFPKPEWADPQPWQDFLANRQRKKLANTLSAYKRFLDDIYRLADDDWPPGRLLDHAAAHGWAGIYDPREKTNDRRNPTFGRNSERSPDKRSGLARAVDDGIAHLDAQLAEIRGRS